MDHLKAEIAGSTERTANAVTPICDKCGGSLAFVGKLPAIGLHPLLRVYKCTPCNHVVAMRR